jgi:hypothetical protein
MLFTTRAIAICGRHVTVLGAVTLLWVTTSLPAAAEAIDVPVFRKGLWRFDRTLEYPDHRLVVRREEATRCVDPSYAMQGVFASPGIGDCRSSTPERADNRYTFANRCDYTGPVRTDITVHSEDAYTELNWAKTGNFPRIDRVLAQRIGECDATSTHLKQDEGGATSEASARRRLDGRSN